MDEGTTNHVLWRAIFYFAVEGLAVYGCFLIYATIVDAATTRFFSNRVLSRHKFTGLTKDGSLKPPKVNLRLRIQNFYRDTSLFYYVSIFRLILNVSIAALYVLATYNRNIPYFLQFIKIVIAGFLSADVIASIAASDSALSYTLSISVFFQAVSLPSLFLAGGEDDYLNFGFLRAFCVYESSRSIGRRLGFPVENSGASFAFGLLAKACTLMYILAAGVQMLEVPGDLLQESFQEVWAPLGDWHFFNAFYFVAVTLTTVGYGDFSPVTVLGRVFVIFMIVLGVIVFADTASRIVEQATLGNGGGSFVKRRNSRHVVVCGKPELSDLIRFTSEFYAKNRLSNASAKVVVLVESEPWSKAEWFRNLTRNEFLKKRVVALTGSVRNADDLRRAQVQTADAIFILSTPANSANPVTVDTRNVMDILAIRNLRTDIPIYTTVLLKSSLAQMRIAQSTPSDLRDPQLLFRPGMHENAQYHTLHSAMSLQGLAASSKHQSASELNHIKSARFSGDVVLGGVSHVMSAAHESMDGAAGAHPAATKDALPNCGEAVEDEFNDLERSSSICLPDLHAALMAAHIKANGVGTLVTNMVLDIVPLSNPLEPAWLTEYHIGAACDLVHLVIPSQLDGVRVDDLAVMLYDHGLVLLTLAKVGSDPARKLILDTSTLLRAGDVGMFLTYHQERYAYPALTLVALKFEADHSAPGEGHADEDADDLARQELTAKLRLARSSGQKKPQGSRDAGFVFVKNPGVTIDGIETSAVGGGMEDTMDEIGTVSPSDSDELNNRAVERKGGDEDANESKPEVVQSAPAVLPCNDAIEAAVNSSSSGSDRDTKEGDGSFGPDGRGNMLYFPEEKKEEIVAGSGPSASGPYLGIDLFDPLVDFSLLTKRSDGYIPDGINRHIIIAIEGESALQNLPLLAKYLWRPRAQKRKEGVAGRPKRPRIPLIVVCPNMTEKFRASFSAYDGKCIFFIDDQLSCRATWRHAKLEHARGVVMLANYGLPWEESDARTLFALMTLDTFIKPEQDCFVVAELIEEKSLEFLREPLHPRRVGVGFGEGSEAEVPVGERSSGGGDNGRRSSFMLSGQADLKKRMTNLAQRLGMKSGNREHSSVGRRQSGEQEMNRGSAPSVRRASSNRKLMQRGSAGSNGRASVYNAASGASYAESGLEATACPGAISGADSEHSDMFRTRRGVLLSRGQYASGDLLLPSACLTLLVREYLEPGFVDFYTNLLGAENHGSLKVRLVRVPGSLFDAGVSVSRVGTNRYILYRQLFVRLMRLGVTPLGLYRSGLAPTRVPTRKRVNRGAMLEEEAVEFIANNPCSLRPKEEEAPAGSILNSIGRFFSSVNPVIQMERKVDEAWNIGHDTVSMNGSEEEGRAADSFEVLSGELESVPASEPNAACVSSFSIPDRSDGPPTSMEREHTWLERGRTSIEWGLASIERSRASLDRRPSSRGTSIDRPNGSGALRESSRASIPKTSSMSRIRDAALPALRKIRGDAGDSPGTFIESENAGNNLPYVLTMPEPYTLVSERDGVYILCDSDFELPRTWGEGYKPAAYEGDGNSVYSLGL